MNMNLFKYYNLEEVSNRKLVINTLKLLKKEGKINYELDGEVFRLDDLDLSDKEIEDLIDLLEENDVFPYLDRESDDDDDIDDDMYDDDTNDYY
jgi:hypothetical protein